MAGRGLGVWIAVVYVMPLILAVEGAFQPAAAWRRVGQPKALWLGLFVGGPVATMISGFTWPGLGTVVASGFFMAKLRSPLLIASGLEREQRRKRPET